MGKEKIIQKDELESLINKKLTGREISSILGITRRTLYNKMKLFGLSLDISPRFNVNVFDEINTREKAYWLGFLYADGYVCGYNHQIELSLKGDDLLHLEKFKKFLEDSRSGNIKVSKSGKFTRCRYIVGNKHFHDQLIKLGCIPNKSLTLKFPDTNIFKNDKFIIDFIRGYVDGDGSLYTTKTSYLGISINGTEDFLKSIRKYFPEFSIPRKDKRSNTYDIHCTHSNACKIANTLYNSATVFLDRKHQKFAELCKKHNIKSGKFGEDQND